MKNVSEFDLDVMEIELQKQLSELDLCDGYKRLVDEKVESFTGFEIAFEIIDERAYEFKIEVYDEEGELCYLPKSMGTKLEKIIYDFVKNTLDKAALSL
jgi:hypothetical protein